MLADYRPPPIDPVVDGRLLDFIAEREDAVPDAWC